MPQHNHLEDQQGDYDALTSATELQLSHLLEKARARFFVNCTLLAMNSHLTLLARPVRRLFAAPIPPGGVGSFGRNGWYTRFGQDADNRLTNDFLTGIWA